MEATRAGTIFATDQKQYDRWKRSAAPKSRPLPDAALEAAIMNIAREFPDNVSRVSA